VFTLQDADENPEYIAWLWAERPRVRGSISGRARDNSFLQNTQINWFGLPGLLSGKYRWPVLSGGSVA